MKTKVEPYHSIGKEILRQMREEEKMNIDEQIKVMQAYRDGAEIEMAGRDGEGWMSPAKKEPGWDWTHCIYRIKPKSGKDKLIDDLDEALNSPGIYDAESVANRMNKIHRILEALKDGQYYG